MLIFLFLLSRWAAGVRERRSSALGLDKDGGIYDDSTRTCCRGVGAFTSSEQLAVDFVRCGDPHVRQSFAPAGGLVVAVRRKSMTFPHSIRSEGALDVPRRIVTHSLMI